MFNLGHGVLPETDPDMLARLTDLVHAESGAGLPAADPASGRAPGLISSLVLDPDLRLINER